MEARSYLFVPATSGRKVDKASASDADAIIIDLEDAVALSEKAGARDALQPLLSARRPKPTWIRVNALDSGHAYHDLLAACRPGTTGVIVPKVERGEHIRTVDWLLSQVEPAHGLPVGSIAIIGIVETARGLRNVDEIAAAHPRLERLMFGAVDLAADLGISLDDDVGATSQARFAVACASRAAGLGAPVDTAYTEIGNPDGLARTTAKARGLGYTSKACIHPSQVETVNRTFSPSGEEIAWARRVLEAFDDAERAGRAAVQLDGEMLDYPVATRARRILSRCGDSQSAAASPRRV